jgi:hypothetical protein
MAYGKGGSPGTPTPDWDKNWPPKAPQKPKPKPKLAKKNKKTKGIYGKSDKHYGVPSTDHSDVYYGEVAKVSPRDKKTNSPNA